MFKFYRSCVWSFIYSGDGRGDDPEHPLKEKQRPGRFLYNTCVNAHALIRERDRMFVCIMGIIASDTGKPSKLMDLVALSWAPTYKAKITGSSETIYMVSRGNLYLTALNWAWSSNTPVSKKKLVIILRHELDQTKRHLQSVNLFVRLPLNFLWMPSICSPWNERIEVARIIGTIMMLSWMFALSDGCSLHVPIWLWITILLPP